MAIRPNRPLADVARTLDEMESTLDRTFQVNVHDQGAHNSLPIRSRRGVRVKRNGQARQADSNGSLKNSAVV